MQARLFSRTGETQGFELQFEGEAIIGRDPQNHLVIDQPLMSSRHARIAYDAASGRFVLEDLDSLNGTELDGDPITGQERLGHLHIITFADTYDFFFQDLERCAKRHPTRIAPSESAAAGSAKVAILGKDSVGKDSVEKHRAGKDSGTEITSVEKDAVGLPDFLARRADAFGEQDPDSPATEGGVGEITMIDREPAALPPGLGQRVDEALAATEKSAPAESEGPGTGTINEKMPVFLPELLARRADAAMKAETLDLDDIEELLSADSDLGSEEESPDENPLGLHLVVTESNGTIRRLALTEGENVIGRSSSVQVPMAYPDLSRRHAVLVVDGERITIRDLDSRNRTFLDDQLVATDTAAVVEIGARLRFGSIEARLVGGSSDDEESEPDGGASA